MDRRPDRLDQRVDDLARRCRDAGMNVTAQRLAVYRALLEADDHPTPEQLYQRVRRRMPSLSLATIYKALEALEKLGAVAQVSPVGDVKRFDANDEHHHHLVCNGCRKVVDFYDERFDALKAPRKLNGFLVAGLRVEVRGLCADCARKGARPRRV